jgi:hypothetical protein
MGINTTLSVLVSDNLRDIATQDAAKAIVAKANAAKQATINAAVSMGDLKALAIAIRPAGEFARVSCPSSLEFGDTDINYHGKRIAGLADAHEIDLDHIVDGVFKAHVDDMVKVGRIAAKIRTTYGPTLKELQAERNSLQAQATKHGDAVRRIDGVIAVMKEELALRQQDRAAYAAKVETDRIARASAKVVAVIQPKATVVPLPTKWLRVRRAYRQARIIRGKETYVHIEA